MKAKSLYRTIEWRRLRRDVLDASGWQCAVCGIHLTGRLHEPHSAIVHHRIPHRGNRSRFFDRSNLVAVCKRCHDGPIQAHERHGTPITITGSDGWPVTIRL